MAISQDWWDKWWEEDFSWDGLANKSWDGWVVMDHGRVLPIEDAPGEWERDRYGNLELPDDYPGRQATLQDYWRDQEEDLVTSPDGATRFTRFHLPLTWRDGSPTGKAEWDHSALDDLIAGRIAASAETEFEYRYFGMRPKGADRRVQFQGGVFLLFSTPITQTGDNRTRLNWRSDVAAFVGFAAFRSAAFYGDAVFRDAAFSESAFFKNADFSGNADFRSAAVSGGALFSNAAFSGHAYFSNVAFSEEAVFRDTAFSGGALFSDTVFSGDATFRNAAFPGDAVFRNAAFSGDANFMNAAFSGDAYFESAAFSGGADFDSAAFSGGALFRCTVFSGNATFRNAAFSGDADFESAAFSGDADFESAAFSGGALFRCTVFSGNADISNGSVEGELFFIGTKWKKRVSLAKTRAPGRLVFNHCDFGNQEQNWRGMFSGARIDNLLDWRNMPGHYASAFDGATLERGLLRDRRGEGEDRKAHEEALKLALKPVNDEGDPDKTEREPALRALEGGALKLKLAMERESDKQREQAFYRLELRARRKQKGTPLSEKLFSFAYAAFSNYGASIGRPFMALFSMIALFAVAFWGWSFALDREATLNDGINSAWQAADLSWSNVFKPLSALSTENDFEDKNAMAYRLLYIECPEGSTNDQCGGVDGVGFAVRAVSTLESFLAIILAFLLALAVRRRFQIS